MPEIQAIRVWSEPQGPLRIECAGDALDEINRLAVEGLLALPRVGLGAGGALIGTRGEGKIVIAAIHPIACSHSLGPAFGLTPEESAAALSELAGAQIVGCFSSKPGAPASSLTDGDLAFFDLFCPEPGQILLRVKPSTVEDSRLWVWFRDASGAPVCGREHSLAANPEPDGPEPDQPAIPPPRLELTSLEAPAEYARAALIASGVIGLAVTLWHLLR